MAQQCDQLDFSGLFTLDVLINLDIASYSFYEVGLKKFLAFANNEQLTFLYINPQSEKCEKNYDWDFVDNPVYCMCFEPSGTWVLIVSDLKILLVPFLPLFVSHNIFDHKWSLSCVTVLPLSDLAKPISVVWWLSKESKSNLIIGSKNGTITFYSLESQSVVGETKVPGEIFDLQICFDDSLDLLVLVISGGKSVQWKLVLEHRSFDYNWLNQIKVQNDKDRKDGFISYIKQFSKEKIILFAQGGSKDDIKTQTVEYVLKPTEYLPVFRKGSNNWDLTAQYVNGRHFLTAFELNEGTMILESPAEDTPSRTLRPVIKKDSTYVQGLWSQRLIYLLTKDHLEVHSANFSVIQGEALLGTKRDHTEIWSTELLGEVRRAYLMSTKEPTSSSSEWREPTFLCDLQLPRFTVEPCLIITTYGAYVLNTMVSPCEWIVSAIMRGGGGAEQAAAALGAPVPALLRAAADMLLSRSKIAPAQYLYSLSQSPSDGWVARLGVFGRLQELSMYKQTGNLGSLGNAAVTIRLLALLLKVTTTKEEQFDTDVKFTCLSTTELLELASISAALGLFHLVSVFTVQRGHPSLMLAAMRNRAEICRGALIWLLKEKCLVPLLLEDNGQWLFDLIVEKSNKFDTDILKCICLWLNPLQDQLRPVMRDMKQGITTVYTTRMLNLISTFVHVASVIDARGPSTEIQVELTQNCVTWSNQFTPRRALSCGLAHWAVADEGNAKIMLADTPVNTELIGRVVTVACGRHHTLILTENGVYAAGDNFYGQLGVGSCWVGAIGDAASPAGALLHVRFKWPAPLTTVAAGHYHSAAVDVGGRIFTWGWGVHGQLGLGNIDDQWVPQRVTKFQGRKVVQVGCGACHTIVLMANGEVWSMGAGVFGQLGVGGRDKSTLPLRVPIADHVENIAVGYFHNLALTNKGQLWIWGASPQQVRATHARRTASPESDLLAPGDSHLSPQLVDTKNISGRIVQLAAGWHHSCVIDNLGNIYSWGLNFDGQLGSGDRKQIQIPTKIVRADSKCDNSKGDVTPRADSEVTSRAVVACGGDFTVFVDDDGKIYATGNMHLQNNVKDKGSNRVIMMKTTKRVIKIPASRTSNKFQFQPIDRIDIMFPFDIDDLERKTIKPQIKPLSTIKDFQKKSWVDDIIILLKPWINEDNLKTNPNMAAKLAFHNKMYSESLRLLLDNLKREPDHDPQYLTHTEIVDSDAVTEKSKKNDEQQITIKNIMSKRIKDISLSILNEEPYPVVDYSIYKAVPCCCNELMILPKNESIKVETNIKEADISVEAAEIIDKCISIFPVDNNLWEICFRISKDFFVENNLCMSDLETVLRKYMKSNTTTMTAAIMYSNDCDQYSKILTSKFYLNMCNEVLDSWG